MPDIPALAARVEDEAIERIAEALAPNSPAAIRPALDHALLAFETARQLREIANARLPK